MKKKTHRVKYPTSPVKLSDGRWAVKYIRTTKDNDFRVFGMVYAESREESETKSKAVISVYKNAVKNNTPIFQSAEHKPHLPELCDFDGDISEFTEKLRFCSDNIALSLALIMYTGIPLCEVCTLKFGDFDIIHRTITISFKLSDNRKSGTFFQPSVVRTLPIPSQVVAIYMRAVIGVSPEDYIITGTNSPIYNIKRAALLICSELGISDDFCVDSLQSIFLEKNLAKGVSLNVIEYFTDIPKSVTEEKIKKEKLNVSDISFLRKSVGFTEENTQRQQYGDFKLLIVTDGSIDNRVKRIAEDSLLYDRIEVMYLTGESVDSELLDFYRGIYLFAIPAIADSEKRNEIFELLQNSKFMIPRLIHPSADVSRSFTTISSGCIIDENAVVHAKTILARGTFVGKRVVIPEGFVTEDFSTLTESNNENNG